MYRIVRASILYYEDYMKGSGLRYELIKPFMLLTSRERFLKAKENSTTDYFILCDIVSNMRSLYNTGKPLYHHFDMLLKELQILGFEVDSLKSANITDKNRLKDQVDLLLQFLAFRYPFDIYDNKTGVHDTETNKFIFVQP
jgi:hypothetical protein